jgi:hypothetical protein
MRSASYPNPRCIETAPCMPRDAVVWMLMHAWGPHPSQIADALSMHWTHPPTHHKVGVCTVLCSRQIWHAQRARRGHPPSDMRQLRAEQQPLQRYCKQCSHQVARQEHLWEHTSQSGKTLYSNCTNLRAHADAHRNISNPNVCRQLALNVCQ